MIPQYLLISFAKWVQKISCRVRTHHFNFPRALTAFLGIDNREAGICFKFAEVRPGVFEGIIINPEIIPPDDIDEVILSRLRQEALEEFKKALDMS